MTISAVTLIQDGGRVAVRFALRVDGRSSRHKRWRVLETHVNSDGDYCGGFMKILGLT